MTRPNQYTRILNYLHTVDEPVISRTISIHCSITPRQAGALLRILVAQGQVSVRRPHRHLGERFPSLYWLKEAKS